MKSVPILPDEKMYIEVLIESMSTDNNHKKLDINDIMKKLNPLSLSKELDIYKPFIIEYTNYRNSEAEVMQLDYVFNNTFIHIMLFYTD